MFHPLYRCSPSTSHYHPYSFQPRSSPFDSYDDLQHQLALAQQQQERREAEEALLLHRQQQLARQREIERRKIAAYEAAWERRAYEEELAEERAFQRARQQAALRERQQRQAIEEEYKRKLVAALEQKEQQEQRRIRSHAPTPRSAVHAEQEQEQDQEDDSHPFHSLLELFFGPQLAARQAAAPQPQPSPTVTAEPAPSAALPSAEARPAFAVEAPASTQPEEQQADVQPTEDEQLQQHYRTHLHRRQALSTLSSLAKEFESQQSSFTVPSTLTFQPSPPPSTLEGDTPAPTSATTTPKLAFKSTNAPFLAYEDFLVRHLSKIDAVSSGGDKTVKLARKQLVKRVDAELARLDAEREKAWAQEKAHTTSEVEQATDDAADPEELPLAEPAPSSSAPADATESPTPETNDSSASPPTPAPTQTDSIPLTAASLASLLSGSRRPARDPSSSDDETESTLSVESFDATGLMDEVMRRAMKLGEQVLEKERLGAEGQKEAEPVEVTI